MLRQQPGRANYRQTKTAVQCRLAPCSVGEQNDPVKGDSESMQKRGTMRPRMHSSQRKNGSATN